METTFRDIRSDQFEAEIARFLAPGQVSRRNRFLCRPVGLVYASNDSHADGQTVLVLQRLVEQETDCYLSGGRPTELHGICVPLH